MKLKLLAAAAAGALALTTAGSAGAVQYLLQFSDAFGTGNFGTVDVTGSATDLHFVVNVAPNFIIDTGSHFAVSMNLAGSGFALTGAPAGFTLTTSATPTLTNAPFTGFDVALNCGDPACGPGGSAPFGTSLTFDITGASLGVLLADPFQGHPINFAVDVLNSSFPAGANTGVVGGGLGTVTNPIPEPATWAMMILGFGGIGTMLRRRRSLALSAA
jgi:hypothetical protein